MLKLPKLYNKPKENLSPEEYFNYLEKGILQVQAKIKEDYLRAAELLINEKPINVRDELLNMLNVQSKQKVVGRITLGEYKEKLINEFAKILSAKEKPSPNPENQPSTEASGSKKEAEVLKNNAEQITSGVKAVENTIKQDVAGLDKKEQPGFKNDLDTVNQANQEVQDQQKILETNIENYFASLPETEDLTDAEKKEIQQGVEQKLTPSEIAEIIGKKTELVEQYLKEINSSDNVKEVSSETSEAPAVTESELKKINLPPEMSEPISGEILASVDNPSVNNLSDLEVKPEEQDLKASVNQSTKAPLPNTEAEKNKRIEAFKEMASKLAHKKIPTSSFNIIKKDNAEQPNMLDKNQLVDKSLADRKAFFNINLNRQEAVNNKSSIINKSKDFFNKVKGKFTDNYQSLKELREEMAKSGGVIKTGLEAMGQGGRDREGWSSQQTVPAQENAPVEKINPLSENLETTQLEAEFAQRGIKKYAEFSYKGQVYQIVECGSQVISYYKDGQEKTFTLPEFYKLLDEEKIIIIPELNDNGNQPVVVGEQKKVPPVDQKPGEPSPAAVEENVITPDGWTKGNRPEGYQSTTEIINKVHQEGLHFTDIIDDKDELRWNELVTKAKTSGLFPAEAVEIAALSKKINDLGEKALFEKQRLAITEQNKEIMEKREQILTAVDKVLALINDKINNSQDKNEQERLNWLMASVKTALDGKDENWQTEVKGLNGESQQEGIPVEGLLEFINNEIAALDQDKLKNATEKEEQHQQVMKNWQEKGADDTGEHQVKMAWHQVYNDLPADSELKRLVDEKRKNWAKQENPQQDDYANDEQFSLQTGEALRQVVEEQKKEGLVIEQKFNELSDCNKLLTDNSKSYFELRPEMKENGDKQHWRTNLEAYYISNDYRKTSNEQNDYQLAMDTMDKRRELVLPELYVPVASNQALIKYQERTGSKLVKVAESEKVSEKSISVWQKLQAMSKNERKQIVGQISGQLFKTATSVLGVKLLTDVFAGALFKKGDLYGWLDAKYTNKDIKKITKEVFKLQEDLNFITDKAQREKAEDGLVQKRDELIKTIQNSGSLTAGQKKEILQKITEELDSHYFLSKYQDAAKNIGAAKKPDTLVNAEVNDKSGKTLLTTEAIIIDETEKNVLMDEINQRNDLTEKQKKQLIDQIEEVIKNSEKTDKQLNRERDDKIVNLTKTYVQSKVSGYQILKDAGNLLATASGLIAIRGVVYAGASAMERGQKAKREFAKNQPKSQTEQAKQLQTSYVLKDVIVNSFLETVEGLSLGKVGRTDKKGKTKDGKEKTGVQLGMDFARSFGSVARAFGIGGTALRALAESHGALGSVDFDKLCQTITDGDWQGAAGKVGENLLHNADRSLNTYLHPLDTAEKSVHGLTQSFKHQAQEKIFGEVNPGGQGYQQAPTGSGLRLPNESPQVFDANKTLTSLNKTQFSNFIKEHQINSGDVKGTAAAWTESNAKTTGTVSGILGRNLGAGETVTVINLDGKVIDKFDPDLIHPGDTVIEKDKQVYVLKSSGVAVKEGMNFEPGKGLIENETVLLNHNEQDVNNNNQSEQLIVVKQSADYKNLEKFVKSKGDILVVEAIDKEGDTQLYKVKILVNGQEDYLLTLNKNFNAENLQADLAALHNGYDKFNDFTGKFNDSLLGRTELLNIYHHPVTNALLNEKGATYQARDFEAAYRYVKPLGDKLNYPAQVELAKSFITKGADKTKLDLFLPKEILATGGTEKVDGTKIIQEAVTLTYIEGADSYTLKNIKLIFDPNKQSDGFIVEQGGNKLFTSSLTDKGIKGFSVKADTIFKA